MSKDQRDEQHRNDIYGDIEAPPSENAPIPAATVCVLRDSDEHGIETLMLRKNSKIAFGGMWVFPGGRLDDDDYSENGDLETAARTAAVREALEEADIVIEPQSLVQVSHWTPPSSTPRRYATWFFAARLERSDVVTIDDGEIKEHSWVPPSAALERHRNGEIDLAPPTWVTLHQMIQFDSVAPLLDHLSGLVPDVYETRIGVTVEGTRVALWSGDAGYENSDAEAAGARHRLVLAKSGFQYERF